MSSNKEGILCELRGPKLKMGRQKTISFLDHVSRSRKRRRQQTGFDFGCGRRKEFGAGGEGFDQKRRIEGRVMKVGKRLFRRDKSLIASCRIGRGRESRSMVPLGEGLRARGRRGRVQKKGKAKENNKGGGRKRVAFAFAGRKLSGEGASSQTRKKNIAARKNLTIRRRGKT